MMIEYTDFVRDGSVSVCVALQSKLHPFVVQCQRRLDYIMKSGAKRGLKLPSVEEITQSLV